MTLLTRDQILAAKDLSTELVEVPEWGGTVKVTTMTGQARDSFEAQIVSDGEADLDNVRAKLVAACLVDEAGAQLFSADDAVRLGKKSAAALERVVKVAQRLNKIGDQHLEELKGN